MSLVKHFKRLRAARKVVLDANATSLTLLDMPYDVLFCIAKWLSLTDVSMLALSRHRFMKVFAKETSQWNFLTFKKFRLLQSIDTFHTDWVLCKNCVKFHKWHPEEKNYMKCPDKTWFGVYFPHLYLHRDIDLSCFRIQLVKRARYYKDLAYGLPIESLYEQHRTLDGWYISVEAVFTRDDALLIKVTNSTMPIFSYSKSLLLDFCGCTRTRIGDDPGSLDPVLDDMDAMVIKCDKALDRTCLPKALVETTKGRERSEAFWYRCTMCLALIHGQVEARSDDEMNWKHSFVRYYDLGPVSTFNDIPYGAHDVEEMISLAKLDYKQDDRGYMYKDCMPRELERFAKGNLELVAPKRTDRLLRHLGQKAKRCWRFGAGGQSDSDSAPEKHRFIRTYACKESCG